MNHHAKNHLINIPCLRFLVQIEPVLIRIRGVRLLWSDVEQLRAESYSQDNKDHEDMLLEVYTAFFRMVVQENINVLYQEYSGLRESCKL